MTDRQFSQESREGDFEVVPQADANGAFMSITTASSEEGDPYENRPDIKEVWVAIIVLFSYPQRTGLINNNVVVHRCCTSSVNNIDK